MDTQSMQEALKNAYHSFVANLYQKYQEGEHKVEEFLAKLHEAEQRHNAAVAAVSTGPRESDEDYRKRLAPIAGDESWKQRIEQSSGDQLDKVGDHFNVARTAPQAARGAQPQDEADRAERLASRNLAPEDGTTADASNKSSDRPQASQTGGVSRAGVTSAQDANQQRLADDTRYERTDQRADQEAKQRAEQDEKRRTEQAASKK